MCGCALHFCRYVCMCVYGVQKPGVCYSLYSHTVFHQGPSCSPQTLSIQFHSLGPLSAVARGWMISNTWEPWEPTQWWNNRGPVSIRALEEDETAGGDDVRIIHTHPHFIRPSWLSVNGTHTEASTSAKTKSLLHEQICTSMQTRRKNPDSSRSVCSVPD